MEPTISMNFTKVLQPDIVANYCQCYINDCHAVVGRSVEITTTFPLEGAIVKVTISYDFVLIRLGYIFIIRYSQYFYKIGLVINSSTQIFYILKD